MTARRVVAALAVALVALAGCAPEPSVRACPREHCIIVRTTIP